MVDRVNVLTATLVFLAVDASATISVAIRRIDFNDEAMPNVVVEHNVWLRIPECTSKLW